MPCWRLKVELRAARTRRPKGFAAQSLWLGPCSDPLSENPLGARTSVDVVWRRCGAAAVARSAYLIPTTIESGPTRCST